jgi:hypothetical protein
MRLKPAFYGEWKEGEPEAAEVMATEVVALLASKSIPVWMVDHILVRASHLAAASPLVLVTS